MSDDQAFRSVLIVCDSPKHARGKVSKLASFSLGEDSGGWYVHHDRQDRRNARRKAAGHDIKQETLDHLKAPPTCKLCGSWPPWPLTVADIDAVLRTGASVLTIRELQVIVRDSRTRRRL